MIDNEGLMSAHDYPYEGQKSHINPSQYVIISLCSFNYLCSI